MNENIIETELDLGKRLMELRLMAKQIMQLSFELREIDRAFPSDYYDFNSAEKMVSLYEVMEKKVLKMAEEIKQK